MTQTYRTTDLTRWGVGKGSRLTPTEVDRNFWDIIQDILALQALDVGRGIDHFEVVGTHFYVHMSDLTVEGPFDLPVATFVDKGTWAPLTIYAPLDTFVINGGIYLVMFAHTSAATFDAGANDGMGHDYYKRMIQTPGSSLPTGGAVGQVVQKSTTSDFAVTWGWKLPTGGAARQYLIKQSGTNQDADWDTPTASDIEFVPVTGSTLTSSNAADAIEEVAELIDSHVVDAADVTFTPVTGSALTSTNVADALEELSDEVTSKIGLADVVGRQTMWVPATGLSPQITNGPAVGNIQMATNKNMVVTLDYDPTTAEYAQFSVAMPKGWNRGTMYFVPYWSHAATTTNFGVVWGLEAIAISNDEVLDVSFGGAAAFSNDTGGTTDKLYVGPETNFNVSGSPADGDLVQFRVFRLPTSGSDTMAIDARLHGVKLMYVTSAPTDT